MTQHISVRVPWHDHGWDGTVCQKPCENNSCLRLVNISENKDDKFERSICGQCMAHNEEKLPCISEGAAFMSETPLVRITIHPYKRIEKNQHSHFLPTEIKYPEYSFVTRPFAWMMVRNIDKKVEEFGVKYESRREPQLGFKTGWIQDAENHKAIFEAFYGDVIADESLIIAYAKQVPFVEDQRRVIIGMGHVKRIVPAVEHKHTDENPLRSMTWETQICHSIRKNHQDGFLIPYQEMMEYANTHPDFDMASITVFAPDDAFEEFSYATEHVSHDAVIDVILSCIKAFEIINDCLDEDYSNVLNWLNEQLAEVWKDRGAFPGMGSMLTALGLPLGVIIARQIKSGLKEGEDIWDRIDILFQNPEKIITENLAKKVTPLLKNTWKQMSDERKDLFRLLSRLSISIDQANMLFFENNRNKARIKCNDSDIINNPYILYEQTRLKKDNHFISVRKIDRAVFPVPSIRDKYPLKSPTKLESDNDQRRIRAMVVAVLEDAANNGHTFLSKNMLVDSIMKQNLDPVCCVTTDMLNAVENFLAPEVIRKEMKDGTDYYKLVRIQQFDEIIEQRISRRLNALELKINADWRKMLDEKFNDDKSISLEEDRARTEKAAILEELAKSRVSVLVGDAGTGKTTVLSVLCSHPDIKAGGVLLLAPTGKATVRLLESMGDEANSFTAMNVAQFLVKSHRFDWNDMRYILSDSDDNGVPDTVIVDESSMLTEEMFGALIQALKKAKRIIFVGDPNQLPPIGAGRPFVDLVYMLKIKLNKGLFPRVCSHYGELTVNRRQKSNDVIRSDVRLSRLFTSSELEPDDDIITQIEKNADQNIVLKKWKSSEELEELLLKTMSDEIGMRGPDDQEAFDISLGGEKTNYGIFFNKGAAKYVENWQILAPVRNMPHGVMNMNRLIHLKYRENYLNLSKKEGYLKRIANSLGPEGIVYGDKVINVVNTSKKEGYPKEKARNYIANGEIGIACSGYNKQRYKWGGFRDDMCVEFASQPGITYSFNKKDFDEEKGTAQLELAYALTVHKAQGSQFDKVILVLAEPCRLLSREMLYTALTRQQGKIIILYNQESYNLLRYSSSEYSDIARRFTDLFRDIYKEDVKGLDLRPQIDEINGKYYEDKLIHKTIKGELVRSKSEVIIANQLHLHGIEYEYEPVVKFGDKIKRPDFKIEDYDTGVVWYWEHCGMLNDPEYARRWEEKRAIYKENGIEEGKNLIVTKDENGSIDTSIIDEIITKTFL